MKKEKTEKDKIIPKWQERGFFSREHYYGFLYFNGLVSGSSVVDFTQDFEEFEFNHDEFV